MDSFSISAQILLFLIIRPFPSRKGGTQADMMNPIEKLRADIGLVGLPSQTANSAVGCRQYAHKHHWIATILIVVS